MGRTLTLPVRQSELIQVLLSRVGVEYMESEERRQTVEFVQKAANLFLAVAPDYLRQTKVRMW